MRKLLNPDQYRYTIAPETITHLEKHVEVQMKENFMDLEANLALLKLYQFYPERTSLDSVQSILLKSLMHSKENTFVMCSFLVPDKQQQQHPTIRDIFKLAELLETAHYKEFWEKTRENKIIHDIIQQTATGFTSAVRDYVLDVLMATYRSVETEILCPALDIQESDVKGFLQQRNLKLDNDGKSVVFPSTESSLGSRQQLSASLPIEQIARVL